MADLLLGPVLRHVGRDDATVWVETDAACEVSAFGAHARTFEVAGHHYALVHATGLPAGTELEYEVALDGERAWPEEGSRFPPSVARTLSDQGGHPLRIAFGSCRVVAPHEPPYTLSKDQDPRGREVDALHAYAQRLLDQPVDARPHLLLLGGDQVYADELSSSMREFIRSRRDPSVPPGETVADFEEYTRLYFESWSDPTVRWLLSTVPSAMIFDDHDVHDDWNTSATWVRQIRGCAWWDERIVGALMSYWIYQHIGNLGPGELHEDECYAKVLAAEGDAAPILREFAFRADRQVEGTRWSYHRDLGRVRLVVMDSRAGRVLTPGERSMVDEDEWRWIEEQARGDVDHLLLGTSLPVFLSPATHELEAWNEAVCDGAWGRLAARAGERIRQGLDLEHWAAFRRSFERVVALLQAVAAGDRGAPPASIIVLSGDVHHAYVARVGIGDGTGTRVVQAVCSPLRNPLDARERRAVRFAETRVAHAITRGLARLAGVPRPPVDWRVESAGPWFDNQIATIDIDGDEASIRVERTRPAPDGGATLDEAFAHRVV